MSCIGEIESTQGWGAATSRRVLKEHGIELDKVRVAIEFFIGRGDREAVGDLGLTPGARTATELAVEEADITDDEVVQSRHIFVGLLHEERGIGAGASEALEVDLRTLTSDIERAGDEVRLRIFLCHPSGDKVAVRQLYALQQELDKRPWLDEKRPIPGQFWSDGMRRVMRDVDIVIVCLSKASMGQTVFVHKEMKFALDRADEQPEGSIFIIPARFEECEVPSRLGK